MVFFCFFLITATLCQSKIVYIATFCHKYYILSSKIFHVLQQFSMFYCHLTFLRKKNKTSIFVSVQSLWKHSFVVILSDVKVKEIEGKLQWFQWTGLTDPVQIWDVKRAAYEHI